MDIKIVITSKEARQRALAVIGSMPLDPAHEVVVRLYKKNRSLETNALYWKWLTVIGNELGECKEDVHERYKEKYLTHIYERDNPEYAEMIQSIREVWKQGMKKDAINLRRHIVLLTSTTTATMPQMNEYLHCIENHCNSLGIRLPYNEDHN